MKHKHLFSLLDQTFTTVRVVFDKERNKVLTGKPDPRLRPEPWQQDDYVNESVRGYVYKVPRAWNVEVQDHLIVLTSGSGLAVVTVIHVDGEPDIDIDASHDYKWAVQKIDLTEFRNLTEREKQFQDTMLEVERVKQRESLVKSFQESLPEGSEARRLFEATTNSLAAPTPTAYPPQPPAPPAPATDGLD
jgi:hypothetical protein